LHQNTVYPSRSRYTLQWLGTEGEFVRSVPHNSDAAFKKNTELKKPSDLLLHYNYGAAAVKMWGQGIEVLQRNVNPPRPPPPEPIEMGPSKTIHDRTPVIQKREAVENVETGGGNAGAGPSGITHGAQKHDTGSGNAMAGARIEGQAQWDEDEVMIFFWGNSKASKDRHRKKLEESTRHMEQWREGVAQDSV
jgi:hypothetical protein